jgi:hypothetical protein
MRAARPGEGAGPDAEEEAETDGGTLEDVDEDEAADEDEDEEAIDDCDLSIYNETQPPSIKKHFNCDQAGVSSRLVCGG